VQVYRHRQAFESLNTQVLLLYFYSEGGGKTWLERTGVEFPLLRDPQRKVYQAYELERSILRSWSPRNLLTYVKAFFQGREIDFISEGDKNQLGGDFIVDQWGIIRMADYSKDPTYRPPVEALLEILRDIEGI